MSRFGGLIVGRTPNFRTQTTTAPMVRADEVLTPQRVLGEVGRGMARGWATSGQQIISEMGRGLYGLDKNDLVDPNTFFGVSPTASRVGRAVFGRDEPFSATTEDVELLGLFGVDPEIAAKTGGTLTMLLTATDLSGDVS